MKREDQNTKNLHVLLPERVDTFNLKLVLDEVRDNLGRSNSELTVNLSQTRFLNLPFIKSLAEMAQSAQQDGKSLVLLNASEKVKKQIGIFSSLEVFQIKRAVSKSGWPVLGENVDF